ncbi:MAG: PEGA domain-containing protein [bacterium]|nr:PEGA domain-containing protein [bacterium]
MKKATILTIILGILLLGVAAFVVKTTLLKPALAGLQVKTVPTSTVFIDGKNISQTPYDEMQLKAGEVTIKLVPQSTTGSFTSFEKKIKLSGGTQTIINWDFGESESSSSGEIMTLEKNSDKQKAGLTIISSPDSSLVKIDGEPKGFTPVSLEKLEAGEKQITLSATGFSERNINAKLPGGYKLLLSVKLAENKEAPVPEGSPTPSPSTSSGSPTPTPKPGSKTTPTPTPTPKVGSKVTPSPVSLKRPYVTIKETPTGWLRVRADASTSSAEVARVNPGESYPLVGEKSGWYRITYTTGKDGWISGQYAEKFE